jgi:hypothetical protein
MGCYHLSIIGLVFHYRREPLSLLPAIIINTEELDDPAVMLKAVQRSVSGWVT